MRTLTIDLAEKFASLALNHVRREFPNKLDHVMNDADDVRSPKQLHPVFYGSFDWHSCVHGYWLLARMRRRYPGLSSGPRIRELFEAQITAVNVAGEIAYLQQPNRATFERPYGWAWALMLAAELVQTSGDDGARWARTFRPLADEFVARLLAFVPKATYPIRGGAHFNTAFAFTLALEYAGVVGNGALRSALCAKASEWYGSDVNCQAWEPSGDDFLSPALVEAECMRRSLGPDAFMFWFDRFLPRIASGEPATLFTPAIVSDRTDGKIGHLDGLNFSRAWCWRAIASSLPPDDPRVSRMHAAADAHLGASLQHVAGDYAGEHWLATFAALALEQH